MKKRAVLFTLALSVCGSARAQGPSDDKVLVNLPYQVTIEDKILQPGDYTIEEGHGAGVRDYILRIYGDNGMKLTTAVTTIPTLDGTTPSQTSLLLDRDGKDFYIDKIWIEGKDYGYQFRMPEILKAREREPQESTSLPARYVRASTGAQWPGPEADHTHMAADRGPLPAEGPGLITQSSVTNEAVNREVGHELTVLPHYGVFDHLIHRVDGDTVTLMGYVTRASLKSDAENAVRKIEGVSRVTNDIEVLPLSTGDDRLRTSVYRAIYGNASMASDSTQSVPPIRIIVRNGNITLEGTVTSQSDKDVADIQANSVPGVLSLANDLIVADNTGR